MCSLPLWCCCVVSALISTTVNVGEWKGQVKERNEEYVSKGEEGKVEERDVESESV